MKLFKIASFLLSVFFLSSCVSHYWYKITGSLITPSQLQHKWVLFQIDDEPIAIGIESTLNISKQNKATGKLACNHFFGTPKLYNNKLRIESIGSTRQSCRGEKGEVENSVSATLNNYSQILLTANQLILIGKLHQLHYRYQ